MARGTPPGGEEVSMKNRDGLPTGRTSILTNTTREIKDRKNTGFCCKIPVMRGLLLSLLCLAMIRPAAADDGGKPVTFSGASASQVISISRHRAGASLWDSGPSDPIASSFDSLLFQGVLGIPGVRFEASLRSPGGWGPWVPAEVETFPNGRFWGSLPVRGAKGAVIRLRAVAGASNPGGTLELFSLEANAPLAENTGPARAPSPLPLPGA